MHRKPAPHYFKSKTHNTLVSVEDVAAAIQALAEKDEVELFELATEGGLDDIFPYEVVTTNESEPRLGRWSDLMAEEQQAAPYMGESLTSLEKVAAARSILERIRTVEMRTASPFFRFLLAETATHDPGEALHDVRLLERLLELQRDLPLDLKELLKS